MKIVVFNTKVYDKTFLSEANQQHQHELKFLKVHLTPETAKLAEGFDAVCAFVNDNLDEEVIHILSSVGVKVIVMRCAGFNNVDLNAAQAKGITVLRVPAYSPHGVAEHAVALMLTLNRRIYKAQNRVKDGNFSLDGLMGFEIHGKTVGVIGTGKIGMLLSKIMKGFGLKVIAYDKFQNKECLEMGVEYVELDELFKQSDIISLHVPLMPETHHIIDEESIAKMKKGVMIINTSRGGLIDTPAVIKGLKSEKIGFLGLDVYEEEADLFFEDLSEKFIRDDIFARLLTFPNVLITGHQAFFTTEALQNIADTTMQNVTDYKNNTINEKNLVTLERMSK